MRQKTFLPLLVLITTCLMSMSNCRSIKDRPQSKLVVPDEMSMEDDFHGVDSVMVYATKVYRGGIFKKAIQGKGYRTAWKMPITVPVVFLDTLMGGLTPVKKGGGKQTLSMDLACTNGDVYTMRSVNKDPSDITPKWAKKMNLDNLVTDGISAEHPYAALPAGAMANALDILNSNPRLVFTPHQKALDTFDAEFGGRIYFIEYEPEGKGNWVNRPNVLKIVDTEDVQKLTYKKKKNKINEAALLRARFFDIVIGDWDRHAKQWGWVVMKTEKGKLCEPMVTDRDNAFYNSGGLVPWIVTRPGVKPFLRPHRKKVDYFQGLVKDFDSYFLLDTPLEEFVAAAEKLQKDMTDELIENAFKNSWPESFIQQDGAKIIGRIKARRDNLPKYAKQFRKALDKKGPLTKPIKGSDKMYTQVED